MAVSRYLVLLLCVVYVRSDDIEMELQSGLLIKMLRDMVNQSKADTLNLPSNATTIRENITDTFSCDNRIYGYYADVDNECQIFHVCLPTQSVSGRNMTYRWSFICPAGTVFNQEYLTCTSPRDSISCEDAPMFYDVNMEFGKVSNETKDQSNAANAETVPENPPSADQAAKKQRWPQTNKRKQNIIVEPHFKEVARNTQARKQDIKEYNSKPTNLIKENIKEYNSNILSPMKEEFKNINLDIQSIKDEIVNVEKDIEHVKDDVRVSERDKMQIVKDVVKEIVYTNKVQKFESNQNREDVNKEIDVNQEQDEGGNEESIVLPANILRTIEEMNAEPIAPLLIEEVIPEVEDEASLVEKVDNSRLASERSLKRKGRNFNRGSIRYKSDV